MGIESLTEYVERSFVAGNNPKGLHRRFYIVMETELGDRIVTEYLSNGCMTWEENPLDLDDRNSLAKVTRKEVCRAGVTLRDMKASQQKWAEDGSSPSCKRYARAVFNRVVASSQADGPKSATKGLTFMKRLKQQQAQARVDNQLPSEKSIGKRPVKKGLQFPY